MDMHTTREVRAAVARVAGVPASQIVREHTLDELGMDSLDLLDLAVEIEETCEVDVPDEAPETWATVGQVIDWVSAHRRIAA